jgi:hypothetical protein
MRLCFSRLAAELRRSRASRLDRPSRSRGEYGRYGGAGFEWTSWTARYNGASWTPRVRLTVNCGIHSWPGR